jgi:lysozyme
MSTKERIKRHEGKSSRPYLCSEGYTTVGYGRNLERVPFSEDEMDLMFENDYRRALDGAEGFFCYSQLNDVRRGVLIEMVFQMGTFGVSKFRRFLDAALERDWQRAHDEMLDSKWAKQTPQRAQELAGIFLKGSE